jgi:lipoate-protein ligase A
MEIRYLDLGPVSTEIYTSLWEYDNVVELEEPTLINFSTNKTLIQFWQGPYWDGNDWKNDYTDLTDFFTLKMGIPVCRSYVPIEINYSAEVSYYVESPNVHNFILYLPNMSKLNKQDYQKRKKVKESIFKIVSDTLYNRGIKTENINNDLYFKHNDRTKKFCGSMFRPAYNNGYGCVDFGLTYDFDFNTANKIRKIDSTIILKKFANENISDVVGGLWEIDKKINIDSQVVSQISKEFGYTLKIDSLTNEEESKLFERGNRRLTEKEWYLYGNNDGFDIYS